MSSAFTRTHSRLTVVQIIVENGYLVSLLFQYCMKMISKAMFFDYVQYIQIK